MLSSPPSTSLPSSSSPPPPPHTVTSASRRVALETYWREVQSIEEEKEGEDEDEDEEDERKSLDEAELDETWLTEAGLSSLVTASSEEKMAPPAEALLSTLTGQQAATVRRRLDNYNETLRKRNKQPIRDVRDVFTQADNDLADRSPSPPSNCSGSSPSRYHVTTKTIRRHTHRVRPSVPMCLFNERPSEDPSSPSLSLPRSPSPPMPVTQTRQPDWMLRDSPYSEGVAEHKQGGACWDCLRFHGDDNCDVPFVPVSPSQGLTYADDLSSCDLTQLGFISHIELSTFLLALGVQTKHTRPPRRWNQDSGVFGVPLNFLLENDRKKFPGVKVPIVLQKLLCILEQSVETEGILRVPGSVARLKYLRRELDRCGGDIDWSSVRQVEAAGLLKLFIRELPTPLLTHTHLSTYHSVLGISSVLHQVQALHLLSLLLPEVNRETLRALLIFLRKVVSHQDQNRMSLWNVSMVMAPNLFSCRHHGNKQSFAKQREEMEEAVGGAHLIRLMITHQDLLWTVPRFLLSQVRQMNQATNQKQFGLTRTTKRLLRRKNDRNQVTELCEGVIRVHAPLHTKVSMAVQLDGQTRAKDVTARFECENSPVQCLYEVGGNICESGYDINIISPAGKSEYLNLSVSQVNVVSTQTASCWMFTE
ncbi:rho GTPase-activating protein 28 isoform X1 [Hippoglossus stenolepis]|uniref:rho GTPase-activating protein 28 isoform X1 n=1 Tax=Hippoglossus stenolepis TaxID=195615 RepID=UPI001FAFF58C|nr:rho GTPase-activating protein 28 isoform X1 [Hippoglossus stenolepis]XP_047193812.1 rho GTPase-activating protein 28 isoform X1 [Hippoglossus stenolepis]